MEPSTKKRKLAPKLESKLEPHVIIPPDSHRFLSVRNVEDGRAVSHQHLQYRHDEPPTPTTPSHPAPPMPPPPSSLRSTTTIAAIGTASCGTNSSSTISASHRRDFYAFAHHLQNAAMLLKRHADHLPYDKASAFLIRWEDDESVESDLDALETVFRIHFRFRTDRFLIPSAPDPSGKLQSYLASVLDDTGPNELVVMYYAGHGYSDPGGHAHWTCSSNGRESGPSVRWDKVHGIFDHTSSDVLFLLDTCAVAQTQMSGNQGNSQSATMGQGLQQVIAACSPSSSQSLSHSSASNFEPTTTTVSFTSDLVECLAVLGGAGSPFTDQKLYDDLLARRCPGQNSRLTASLRLPAFFTLSPGRYPNIRLSPMSSPPPSSLILESQNKSDETAAFVSQTPSLSTNSLNGLVDARAIADLKIEDNNRVLVCTTFVGDASEDMSNFHRWLQRAPSHGAQISVEGIFLGTPTTLLVSMPADVYDALQGDHICLFLGNIRSHNLIQLYHSLLAPASHLGPSTMVEIPSATTATAAAIPLTDPSSLGLGQPRRHAWMPSAPRHETDPIPPLPDHGCAPAEARELDLDTTPSALALRCDPFHSQEVDLCGAAAAVAAAADVVAAANAVAAAAAGELHSCGPAEHPSKPELHTEDSAEMTEAAEQLKALRHIRHQSDEARQPRSLLPPDGPPPPLLRHPLQSQLVQGGQTAGKPEDDGFPTSSPSGSMPDGRTMSPRAAATNGHGSHRSARRPIARHAVRLDSLCCEQCIQGPFKDWSALRKHVAASHTRPFPCAFAFAGCGSTFGSKNEWKRHIASQHLCLQYYRCSACAKRTAADGRDQFNRKDLFTQHLRRMHAPFALKKTCSKGDAAGLQAQLEWDAQVRDMQQSCLVVRRQPPARSACPNPDCQTVFEGGSGWDEWTEHVGRHLEKADAPRLGFDQLLADWAEAEGIIDRTPDGAYRLRDAAAVPTTLTLASTTATAPAPSTTLADVTGVVQTPGLLRAVERLDPQASSSTAGLEADELSPLLPAAEASHGISAEKSQGLIDDRMDVDDDD